MWSGGIADPQFALEQLSYLLLLKQLDGEAGSADSGHFAARPELRWERLGSCADDQLLSLLEEELVPFLVAASGSQDFHDAMREARFSMPTPGLVRECMHAIDGLAGSAQSTLGDVYEGLLDGLPLAEGNGQLRTPPHLIEAMVDLVEPRKGQVICDPAAGSAGFLVETRRRLPGQPDESFRGFDIDSGAVRIGLLNMVLHGIARPYFKHVNTLSHAFSWPAVDVVLTSPPFGATVERFDVHPDLGLETSRSELLFLELCRNMLWRDGKAAIVVPEGVLFGRTAAHVECRRRWLRQGRIEAVVSLPAGMFLPYTNVKTAILFATAPGTTKQVWFCPVESDGYSLDGRREMLAGPNDLEFMAEAVKARIAGTMPQASGPRELAGRMWSVAIDEIAEQGWSLAPSAYPGPAQAAVVDQDPVAMFDQLDKLDAEIRQEVAAARAIIEERR